MNNQRSIYLILFSLILYTIPALASAAPITDTIGDLFLNFNGSMAGIGSLIISMTVISGLGFGVAAIFKFKQHRDNPTQVTLGQPLALLAISVCLIWLQVILFAAGNAIHQGKCKAGDKECQSTISPSMPDVFLGS